MLETFCFSRSAQAQEKTTRRRSAEVRPALRLSWEVLLDPIADAERLWGKVRRTPVRFHPRAEPYDLP